MSDVHAALEPSRWVRRWSHLVAPDATVLDVACGSGRHLRWFAARGARVTGVDRDAAALEPLRALADVRVADIEHGPWPFPGARFDAVVCTNYLWRALLPTLVDAVGDGGVLIYETFSAGNESVGKPTNPQFLLRRGELLEAVATLQVVGFEEGFLSAPDRFVQRVVAVREGAASVPPQRWALPEEPEAVPAKIDRSRGVP
ncbi:MAG: class I SAM-dependent methyltransferase [Caldimonas sp.]